MYTLEMIYAPKHSRAMLLLYLKAALTSCSSHPLRPSCFQSLHALCTVCIIYTLFALHTLYILYAL